MADVADGFPDSSVADLHIIDNAYGNGSVGPFSSSDKHDPSISTRHKRPTAMR